MPKEGTPTTADFDMAQYSQAGWDRSQGVIQMHLEGMREDGDPIPSPTTWTDLVEVA
jgi:hypothetical protein